MVVNAEILATGLRKALREGNSSGLGRWIESAIEFMQRQDHALRDAREGMRQALAENQRIQVERDACLRRLAENDEEIVRLRRQVAE
jgi:hypothetical protein